MPTNFIASLFVSATLVFASASAVMLLPGTHTNTSDVEITFNWK